MTTFESILIVLAGMGPVILPLSILISAVAYRRTKSGAVLGVIVVATVILLIPSMVYFWAWMVNG